MSEPGMPFPRGFVHPCSEMDWLLYCQLQEIETIDVV
jgi:hypothetical protein